MLPSAAAEEILLLDDFDSVGERNKVRRKILHCQTNNLHLYRQYSFRLESELLRSRNETYQKFVDVGILCPLIINKSAGQTTKQSEILPKIDDSDFNSTKKMLTANGTDLKSSIKPTPFVKDNLSKRPRSSTSLPTHLNTSKNFDINPFVWHHSTTSVASSIAKKEVLATLNNANLQQFSVNQTKPMLKKALKNADDYIIRPLRRIKDKRIENCVKEIGVEVRHSWHLESSQHSEGNHLPCLRRYKTDQHPVTTGLRERGKSVDQIRWRPVQLGERPVFKVWSRELENGGERLALNKILREDTVYNASCDINST